MEDAPVEPAEETPTDPQENVEDITHYPNVRRSGRATRLPERYSAGFALQCLLGRADDPLTVEEALASDDVEHWKAAMKHELTMINRMKTWAPAFLPEGASTVATKWVFQRKHDKKGRVKRYRARIVAKGFTQIFGVDFDEVFAPVARYTTVRYILSLCVLRRYKMFLIDVKNAFLNGTLSHKIYAIPPEDFKIDPNLGNCMLLFKALYGLKQAARVWHQELEAFLLTLEFRKSNADPTLFVYSSDTCTTFMVVYVDDILLVGDDEAFLCAVSDKITTRFNARLEEDVSKFLGMAIEHYENKIVIHNEFAIRRILHRFNMSSCRHAKNPLPLGLELDESMSPQTATEDAEMRHYPYQELVGALLYLASTTRPDISYSVGLLARYMSKPGKRHWQAAIHVVRYLAGTASLGISYERNEEQHLTSIVGYSDADFAGDRDGRKSTSGFVFMLAGGAVSWSSKKQTITAQSTVEAEYIALSFAVREGLWLRKLMAETFLQPAKEPLDIRVDNQDSIALASNDLISERSKHIGIKYHLVKDVVRSGEIRVQYIPTAEMTAEVLTKLLSASRHDTNRASLGIGQTN